MSWLSDNFDFEMFNLGDMWENIKEQPETLLLGAADPFGAELWSGITGNDYQPTVNALGGPMGGGSLGIGSGGVYDRAQEAGIDTGAAMGMHDIAEVVAGAYGAAGAYGGLQNAAGSLGGGAEGALTEIPAGDFAPLERSGSLGGSGSGGMFDFGNMDWSDPNTYMDLMQQMPQGMGGQEEQQPGMRPMPNAGRSGYMPMDVGAPEVFSPQRSTPFGLLNEEDDMEKLRRMLGGIL